ncbi:ATPase [Aureococcus anophagefferens]|nr:ATPase [Aureococcus anophagefferens]
MMARCLLALLMHKTSADVHWRDLAVRRPDGAFLLEPCSGTAAAGTFTAVLGASGAGKSTLLRALDSELFAMLTVRETLEFAHALRGASRAEAAALAERGLRTLGFLRVADGRRRRRGGGAAISGGERRRLCPSSRVWRSYVDGVVLLAPGGRVAYAGPRDRAAAFARAATGRRLPPFTNPAEWLLELVADEACAEQLCAAAAQARPPPAAPADDAAARAAALATGLAPLRGAAAISMCVLPLTRALDLFGKERKVVAREVERGAYGGGEYVLAKALAEVPSDALAARSTAGRQRHGRRRPERARGAAGARRGGVGDPGPRGRRGDAVE